MNGLKPSHRNFLLVGFLLEEQSIEYFNKQKKAEHSLLSHSMNRMSWKNKDVYDPV